MLVICGEGNWEAQEKADKLAGSGSYITSKDNPLVAALSPDDPVRRRNMETLHRDVRRREAPTHRSVYAGIMDNMRYNGGNE